MIVSVGFRCPLDVKLAPSVTKRFGTSQAWLYWLRTDVAGSLPIGAGPIRSRGSQALEPDATHVVHQVPGQDPGGIGQPIGMVAGRGVEQQARRLERRRTQNHGAAFDLVAGPSVPVDRAHSAHPLPARS